MINDKKDNELNITSIQELLNTVPDPYGGLEVEYTKPEDKFNNKVNACIELINLGFDPFKYASDNNIKIHNYNSIGINLKNKFNNDICIQSIDYNKGQIEEDEYTNEKLTLAVETKKILDELSAKKALEDNKARIIKNKLKSLDVINNGGKSAFRKSTESNKQMINVSYEQIANSHLLDINNSFVNSEVAPNENIYIEKLDIIDNGTEQALDIIKSETNHAVGKYGKILDSAFEKYEELKNSKENL